jgi:RNA polymerase sigma factor (sigma-70 family)
MPESGAAQMTEQDRKLSAIVGEERSRLRRFISRRVPAAEVEDLLQEVFTELVEANRMLMPIDHVTGWLFQVARNRIVDWFRKKKPEPVGEVETHDGAGEMLSIEELMPSPDAGPEAIYFRGVVFDELDAALDELPEEQRQVFLAHEVEGRSFKEIAAETGVNINTLLARKRYAVLYLRERLQDIYNEFLEK